MAIPLFVKVTPFVAKKMKLDKVRFKTADGNYMLRQLDFLIFGPLFNLRTYAERVGGVVLRDAEAAANMRGELNTELPVPADEEWIDPDAGREPELMPEEGGQHEPTESAESESPAENDSVTVSDAGLELEKEDGKNE